MDYIRAKVAVSVPYEEGRHVHERSGTVIPLADVTEFLQEKLVAGDPWLENLFEPATEADYEHYRTYLESLEAGESEAEIEPVAEAENEHPMKTQRKRKAAADKEADAS